MFDGFDVEGVVAGPEKRINRLNTEMNKGTILLRNLYFIFVLKMIKMIRMFLIKLKLF